MARPTQPVHLPLADQSALRAIVKKGTHKSRTITRANALLRMGAGGSASAVQVQAGISSTQYHRLSAVTWTAAWPLRWKSARAAGNRQR